MHDSKDGIAKADTFVPIAIEGMLTARTIYLTSQPYPFTCPAYSFLQTANSKQVMSNHDDHKYKHLAIVAISDRETSKLQFSCVILNPVTANTAITRRGVLKIATWIMGEKMGLLGWIHMIAIERMHMQLVKDFMMLALCKHKRDS